MFHDIDTYCINIFKFGPKNMEKKRIFQHTLQPLFFGWKRPGTVLSTSSSWLRSSTWKSWPYAPSRTPWPATPGARLRPALRWWHGSSGTAGTAAMSWVRLEVMAWQWGKNTVPGGRILQTWMSLCVCILYHFPMRYGDFSPGQVAGKRPTTIGACMSFWDFQKRDHIYI